jgi:hypothetical protein
MIAHIVSLFWVLTCLHETTGLINTASHWEFGGLSSNSRCEYLFHQSIGERVNPDRRDPLLIWLGRPSSALQTLVSYQVSKGEKIVPLPLPTLWISYANILYVTKCFSLTDEGGDQHGERNGAAFEDQVTPIIGNTPAFVKALENFLTRDLKAEKLNLSASFRFEGEISEVVDNDAYGDIETYRSLYVGGNMADEVGGMHTIAVITMLASFLNKSSYRVLPRDRLVLKGALIGDAASGQGARSGSALRYRPSAQFVPFKSFESIPGHVGSLANPNVYKLDRIAQPVTCNNLFAGVELWLHDLHLRYVREPDGEGEDAAASEMYEYTLSTISTFAKCYRSVADWRSDPEEPLWNTVAETEEESGVIKQDIYPTLPYSVAETEEESGVIKQDIYPTLPYSMAVRNPFPSCQLPGESDQSMSIGALLEGGLTVVTYSTIRKSARAICSFYIGIFEADALQWSTDSTSTEELRLFDAGSLVDVVEDAGGSTTVDMVTVGQVQDGGSNPQGGRLVWSHFDSSSGGLQRDEAAPFVSVSKHTAVDILKRLLEGSDEINYVDIYA